MGSPPRRSASAALSRQEASRCGRVLPPTFKVGNISRSSSRYIRLWWFCIEMNGVRLWVIA